MNRGNTKKNITFPKGVHEELWGALYIPANALKHTQKEKQKYTTHNIENCRLYLEVILFISDLFSFFFAFLFGVAAVIIFASVA